MTDTNIIEEIEEQIASRFTEEHLNLRPKSIKDLPQDQQHGDTVVTIDMDALPPALWGKAGDFIEACRKAGMLSGKDYGGHKAWTVLESDEAAHRIDEAAHRWDKQADQYDACLVTRRRPEDYSERYQITSYCDKRKLAYPWNED